MLINFGFLKFYRWLLLHLIAFRLDIRESKGPLSLLILTYFESPRDTILLQCVTNTTYISYRSEGTWNSTWLQFHPFVGSGFFFGVPAKSVVLIICPKVKKDEQVAERVTLLRFKINDSASFLPIKWTVWRLSILQRVSKTKFQMCGY